MGWGFKKVLRGERCNEYVSTSVADPGSGIGFFCFSDSGSQTHIFDSFMSNFSNFGIKNTIISSVLATKSSLPVQKYVQFYDICGYKNGRTKKFSLSSLGAVRSRMDKKSGFATLVSTDFEPL